MNNYLCNNPLVPQRADPWIYKHTDGFYYFTASVPEFDRIELRRARKIADLAGSEARTVWRRHTIGLMSAYIWAPELHYINARWYIYFAAAETPEVVNGLFTHRIYVLENSSPNPLDGAWEEKGSIHTRWDTFSLDATSFSLQGSRYLVWAQKDPGIAGNSNLYIARMENPWTLESGQVMLSKPEYPWETVGFLVNEGPAVLIRGEYIFITYSCSATDENYCLGLLHARIESDLLNPSSWKKSPSPVFQTSLEANQFGPGHNSFTRSEDDRKDLLVYHARNYTDLIGGPLSDPNRHTRIQEILWGEDGFPVFGLPVPDGPLFYGS